MGKLDDLEEELARKKAEVERRAALEAGKVAVKSAWKGLVAAVGGVADSVLGSAERELEEARAARGKAPPGGEVLDDPMDETTASNRALENVRGSIQGSGQPSARDRRLAREARARAELEALKRGRGEPAPLPADEPAPDAEPVVEARYEGPGAELLRERRERELRAERELEAIKERQIRPEERDPVKRTL